MNGIYLSLGSNMGDRVRNIARAVEALAAHGVRVVRQSLLYETEPVDMQSKSWFLNCVIEVETDLAPQPLMQALLEIERSLGRNRAIAPNQAGASRSPKESRTIDIDILFFGATIVSMPDLEIPHPRMSDRRFVLVPFAEIAPDARHPILKKTIAELLLATSDRSQVRRKATE
jgi:2-amino-4-hydroxy-6-hydroxymethyldihydropteridine diphosphokinase